MTEHAISLRNVNKTFKVPLDRSTTLKYRVTHLRSASRYRLLHALDDVSFDVPEGQFLGITGHNGCGKSTLLKILSRIYEADSGTMAINSMVSPFLELGVGFNPELTARENIFLGGAVLGLTRPQLRERVDHILDFADLTDFADAKLKNFSSGMQVRLAFSVAIQADAGILLMDEVLAVGDAQFQAKCFDIFSRYKREGRTIVLVSHDLNALTMYCDRVLLMADGRIVGDGPAAEIIAQYRRMVGQKTEIDDAKQDASAPVPTDRWGSREIEVTAVRVLNAEGVAHTSFTTGDPMTVEVDYLVHKHIDQFTCMLAIRRSDGLDIARPDGAIDNHRIACPQPGVRGTVRYSIPACGLLQGAYQLSAGLYDLHGNHPFDHIENIAHIRMVDERGRNGIIDLSGQWTSVTAPAGTAAPTSVS